MPRTYTKMENLAEEVFRRKEADETNRQITESYGLSKKQINSRSPIKTIHKREANRCARVEVPWQAWALELRFRREAIPSKHRPQTSTQAPPTWGE